LISDYSQGFYFGGEISGVHGGLHTEDSLATLAYGWPESSAGDWAPISSAIEKAIKTRCEAENGRMAQTTDMLIGLNALLEVF
jgi:hypothetical protein